MSTENTENAGKTTAKNKLEQNMKSALFLCSLILAAPVWAQQYADWKVSKPTKDIQIAATSSGTSELGVICFVDIKNCSAYLSIDGLCAENDYKIPMLINSSIGALYATTKCLRVGNTFLQIITEFDNAKLAMESGGEVGVAVPLANGTFRVVSFSTIGGAISIKEAMRLPPQPALDAKRADVIL